MASDLILAIDQGTHSTRAIVFNTQGKVVALARKPVTLQRHSRTEVEQSAGEILQSMFDVVDDVLQRPVVKQGRILSAGLATQRSSVLAWERGTGKALSPVLSWQDRRVEETLQSLASHESDIRKITGLHLSPHYGAGKLQWLLSQHPVIAETCENGALTMGPLASYLLHHLVNSEHEMVDHANASRTLLWDLQTRDWSSQLLELFSIPRDVLPECQPICSDYGLTVNGSIPLTAVNGDQTAALYAQGMPSMNTIRINIGTGAFVLMPVNDPGTRPDGLLAGISKSDTQGANYYIEGTVNGAAAALKWAKQRFNISGLEEKLPAWLDTVTEPPLFLNSIGGLGAPWWKPGLEPRFTSGAPPIPAAMVAVIESIVFLMQANIALMCDLNSNVENIQISGGLSKLDGLCKKLATISGLPVYRPGQVEATARGIAWQAAGCPEDWPASGPGETFEPVEDAALVARYSEFIELLESSL
jgi:glycerol kinase